MQFPDFITVGVRTDRRGSLAGELAAAALELTEQEVVYDPGLLCHRLSHGDVPADRGVCTDVVIRAYRALGH